MTNKEAETVLEEPKQIFGDIQLRQSESHAAYYRFKVPVEVMGFSLWICGNWNPSVGKLSYSILMGGERIYGLDLGGAHRQPSGELLEGTHKQRWTEEDGMAVAYEPPDITAEANDPKRAWVQFCQEANIEHDGSLEVPILQTEIT